MTEAHVAALEPQDEQADLTLEERMHVATSQAGYGPSWAALDEAGQVLAIGGMCESWPGRAICWSGLSRHIGPRLLAVTRELRRVMDAQPYQRLETFADAGSEVAQRWARLLGFELETPTPMRRFLPDGRAAYLYGRVKE